MAEHDKNSERAADDAALFCAHGAPIFERRIAAYRSLPPQGFAITILLTLGMLFLPLIAVLGSPVLWGLLPPALAVLAALWVALRRNTKDGEVYEEIRLWRDLMDVTRINPRQPAQNWQANPQWVKTHLHPRHRIKNYLTLTGGGREIELGSFLQPEERVALCRDLEKALARAKSA